MNIWGSYRTFEIADDHSTNHKLLHLLDGAEGLHNNHHRYPSRYDMAINQGEFDPAGWAVKKFFEVKSNKV
jgi:fatty-acid desaturase